MSETPSNKPKQNPDFLNLPQSEKFAEEFGDIRDKARETLNNPPTPEVQKAKNFFEQNKPLILTVASVYVLYKIEKRMVTKVVTKAIREIPGRLDVARYEEDLQNFYAVTRGIQQ